ncbi:MAG: prolipoprotein diacylglyceryl transferase [Rikenellaceae bacterium]|jgi:prolipoprotein diacylglyceryl transferase|nr:prolipoprotein diacylglyceryl transferase [Rikenellaceae bacterium]
MTSLFSFLSVTWDVNPVIFHIFGRGIRWYGLLWGLAFVVGYRIFEKIVKREDLPTKVLESIFWYTVVATVFGAKLGHYLFYEPAEFFDHPFRALFLEWQGGFASHGAAIGILIGLWLFSWKNKLPYVWSLDRIGIVVASGGALIRLGNLMNSEIYGTPTDLPWGFIFVRNGETVPMHPTQLYEALAYLVLFGVLYYLYFKKDLVRKRPGVMFGIFLIVLFVARFFIEFVKNPQVAFEESMALDMGQWLSVPFIVAGIVILALALRRSPMPVPAPKPASVPKTAPGCKKK